MAKLNFWKDWKLRYRGIYQVLLFIFLLSIAYSFYNQNNSYDLSAPMDVVRKTQNIELSLQNVQDFVFELPVPARNYVILQGYLAMGSGFELSGTYLLIAIIFCCFSILMTASTYLSRWWFIVFQSVFVVWLITLKLPYLEILGVNNQTFTFVFVGLILAVGYYFHAFKDDAGLFQRWLAFALILISLILLVILGSPVEAPVVFMAHHGIIVPIILSIIFIFNVAYEIILHILYILAAKKSSDGSSNLIHFIVLCMLYLVYVGLTFAKNDNIIDWNIVYLNEFVLLGISAVLGIWGFKKRSELLGNQLSFRPLGGYVYLVLGILTFSVLAWVFKNGNDPLMDTFEDMIIFSHLGFGVLFFFYVLYNFVALLNSGMGIYPIVFRPVNIPYNLVRFVGFGIVVVLVLRVSYLPYYQAISGYYNSLADYYEYIGEDENAKTTYKIARQYASTAHKHNFKIGQMEYEDKNWAEASAYFNRANFKRPSVQSYINRAQAQLNANLVFEALFTLEDAQKDFPDNGYLLNMKGLVFEKLNKTDSAFIYFDAAERTSTSNQVSEVASVNRLGLFAKNAIDEDLPKQAVLNNKSVAFQANYLALANRKREYIDSIKLDAEKIPETLTYNDFSFIFNYTLNKTLDNQEFDADTIMGLSKLSQNEDFAKSLKYAASTRLNYSANINQAYSYIYSLENADISDAGFYYLVHGLWLLDQKAYTKATEHFKKAAELKMSKAKTYQSIALILDEKLFEAAQLYNKHVESESIAESYLEQDPLYQFLQGNTQKLPDSFIYLWLKTNSSLQSEEKDSIKNNIKDSPFFTLLSLNEAESDIISGNFNSAKEKLKNLNLPSQEEGLRKYCNNLRAALAVISNDQELTELVDESSLSVYPYNYKGLWGSFMKIKNGDKDQASTLAWELGKANAFFEIGVMFASHYFNEQDELEKSYEILVEASRLNPNSTELLKAYTLQALRLNLPSYAEDAYQELSSLLSAEEWEEFSKEYQEIKEKMDDSPW
ncbi:MAG: tetratricopeptide repeat protein [Bacteroidota bacterium]